MRNIFLMLGIVAMLGGCATYRVDKQATAAAPWKVGEVMTTGQDFCYDANNVQSKCEITRRFMGVTTTGCYLLQDFYTPASSEEQEVKYSSPFCFVLTKDVTTPHLILRGYFKGDRDNRVISLFYKSGQKREDSTYDKTGHKHGLRIEWYESGNKLRARDYEHNKLTGSYQSWFETGQLKKAGQAKEDKPVGIWKRWDEQGELIEEADCDKVKCSAVY